MKKAWLLVLALTAGADAKKIAPPSVNGRVIKYEISSTELIVTAAAGSEQGVERTYTCTVLVDDKPIAGTRCTIIRVDKRMTVVKTDVPSEALSRSSPKATVRFDPAR